MFKTLLSGLHSDKKGSVAIMSALLTPMLVGGLAIGVDTAYWRYRSSILQMTSDGVAMSLALDIGNGVMNTLTLQDNAQKEAVKYGCVTGSNCAIQVTYPYGGNPSAVRVVALDNNSKRFFSVIYDVSAKSLQGRSVAVRYFGSSTGVPSSACILALGTGQTANGIYLKNPLDINAGCEIFANDSGSQAIYGANGPAVHGLASTTGQIAAINMGSGGFDHPNPGVPSPLPDPYASLVAASPFFTYSNLPAPPYSTTSCIEELNNPNNTPPLVFGSQSQASNLASATAQGYSFDSNTNTHILGGGGGVFCNSVKVSNGYTLKLGPGIWIFADVVSVDGTLDTTKTGLDANGNPTQLVNPSVPGVASGTYIDGSTLIWGWKTLSIVGATLNLTAPKIGPTAGLAMSGFKDFKALNVAWQFVNGTAMTWTGAIYAPNIEIRVENSSGPIQAAPHGIFNSPAGGCIQIVAMAVTLINNISVGNSCSGYAVKPFGTTSGWYGNTNAPAVKARFRLEAAP